MPMYRYPFDRTGVSPDNLVQGEEHDLVGTKMKVLSPRNGAYYKDSLKIKMKNSPRVLVPNNDYVWMEMSVEATIESNHELEAYYFALITNQDLSGKVVLDYQAVGGDYMSNADIVERTVQLLIDDGRPVDWATGVLNKPNTFPGDDHGHTTPEELNSFQGLVAAVERMKNAVLMVNHPGFARIIDWLTLQLHGLSDTIEVIRNENAQDHQSYESSLNEINNELANINELLTAIQDGGIETLRPDEIDDPETHGGKLITLSVLNLIAGQRYVEYYDHDPDRLYHEIKAHRH